MSTDNREYTFGNCVVVKDMVHGDIEVYMRSDVHRNDPILHTMSWNHAVAVAKSTPKPMPTLVNRLDHPQD